MFMSVVWAYFSDLPLLYREIGGEERMPQAIYLKLLTSLHLSCFSSCLVLHTVLGALQPSHLILPISSEKNIPLSTTHILSVDHTFLQGYLKGNSRKCPAHCPAHGKCLVYICCFHRAVFPNTLSKGICVSEFRWADNF